MIQNVISKSIIKIMRKKLSEEDWDKFKDFMFENQKRVSNRLILKQQKNVLNKINHIQEKEIIRLYSKEKLSINEIDYQTRFNKIIISSVLKKNNIPLINRVGELSPSWKGGMSFEPYGLSWTSQLKKSIRDRDDNVCQLCGKHRTQLTRNLCVHHIDYIKVNNFTFNLISLCDKCHALTNSNRCYWTPLFRKYLTIKYGYKYSLFQQQLIIKV